VPATSGSARGAAFVVAQAIGVAIDCGATGEIIVRADSAFYAKNVLWACRRKGARFSITVRIGAKIRPAIAAIGEHAWLPIKYPNAVWDADEQRWVSEAEIAELRYTAFAGTRWEITARLIVRRIPRRDRQAGQAQDQLFPTWRCHALFTDSPFVLVRVEAAHRGHAVIEQVLADLIDGPLAHLPYGDFAANAAWLTCAAIAHNLTRAAGHLAAPDYGKARAATIRRELTNVTARLARRAAASSCTCPNAGPGSTPGTACSPRPRPHQPNRPQQTVSGRPPRPHRHPRQPATLEQSRRTPGSADPPFAATSTTSMHGCQRPP
jgi:Transposase DDE domain group 1